MVPKKPKVAKLLAPTTKLSLKVDEGEPEEKVLELSLAWTMRGVIILESKLRAVGYEVNVLQNPSEFWGGIDCTKLAVGIWAMAQQEHPEYADEEGFEIISSYLVPDNYTAGATGLKEAFLASLSQKQKDRIKELDAQASTADPTQPQVAQ